MAKRHYRGFETGLAVSFRTLPRHFFIPLLTRSRTFLPARLQERILVRDINPPSRFMENRGAGAITKEKVRIR